MSFGTVHPHLGHRDLLSRVSYPPVASYISSYLSVVPSSFRPVLSRFGRFDITAAPFPNSYNFRGGRRSTFDGLWDRGI